MKHTRSIGHSVATALATTIIALSGISNRATAQFSVTTTTGNTTQNFDALAISGGSWVNDATTTAGDSTLDGWSLFNSLNAPISTYLGGIGNSTAGGFYSFGSASATERALGGLGSGGTVFGSPASGARAGYITFSAVNNTTSALTTLNVAFDGEQWRNSAAAAQTMVFEYGVGADFSTVTWTAAGGSFNWASPVTGGTAAAIDGNAAGLVAARGGTLNGVNWGAGDTLWLRWVETNDIGNDHGLAIDNFSLGWISGPAPKNLHWTPTTNLWNTTDTNWTDVATSNLTTFSPFDTVRFDADAGGPVQVAAGGISTGGITVAATAGTYSFTGGPIGGSGGLTKSEAGNLDFSGQTVDNTFTGQVTITGGTATITRGGHLGAVANTVVLDTGATLNIAAPITNSHAINVGLTGATIAIGSNSIVQNGAVTINGPLSLVGAADLNIIGVVTFGNSGTLTIPTGIAVTFSEPAGVISMRSGGIFDGNFNINTTARFNINGFGMTYGGTGKINILGTAIGAGSAGVQIAGGTFTNFNALITNSFNQGGGTITSDIVLNSPGTGHVAFTPGNITTPAYTTASFLAFIGSDTTNLDIAGKITGEGDLFLAASSATGGAGPTGTGGTLSLLAQNTYTGNTLVDSNGRVVLGVDNALPVATNVIFGNLRDVGSPTLDLNGFNQQIASLSHGGQGTPANFTITNNSPTADSTLTVTGSVTPANPFGGKISDGFGGFKTKLVKAGTNTLTLNGAAEFSTLSVKGGILNLDTALINITSDSTIDVTPAAGGSAHLKIGASQTIASLDIGAGGVVTLEAPSVVVPAAEFGLEAAAVQPVPEPGTAIFLFTGIATLLGSRRKR